MKYLVLILLTLLPANAHAWRQTKSCIYERPPAPTQTPRCQEGDVPVGFSWPEMPVEVALNDRGLPGFQDADGKPSTELLDVVTASLQTWNQPECSGFEFAFAGLASTDSFANDDVNIVVFHTDQWPYGDGALAVTSVTARLDGTLINADVEVNGADHDFAIVQDDATMAWDLQNTLTHEAGHILGLDHDAVEGSTMEFEAKLGETSKRELHADDIAGLCAIYPAPPEPEDAPDDGCCTTAPAKRDDTPMMFVIALLAVTRVRRTFSRASA